MHDFEIRILQEDGGTALLVAARYLNDTIALSAARKFAGSHKFEVWRGTSCISGTGGATVVYLPTDRLARAP